MPTTSREVAVYLGVLGAAHRHAETQGQVCVCLTN